MTEKCADAVDVSTVLEINPADLTAWNNKDGQGYFLKSSCAASGLFGNF